jgi:hypothetical protein
VDHGQCPFVFCKNVSRIYGGQLEVEHRDRAGRMVECMGSAGVTRHRDFMVRMHVETLMMLMTLPIQVHDIVFNSLRHHPLEHGPRCISSSIFSRYCEPRRGIHPECCCDGCVCDRDYISSASYS